MFMLPALSKKSVQNPLNLITRNARSTGYVSSILKQSNYTHITESSKDELYAQIYSSLS